MYFLDNKPGCGVKLPNLVDGTKFQRELPALSQTEKALRGYQLQSGTTPVTKFSPRQSSALAEVPMKLIRTVARATPPEYAAMQLRPLTVEELHAQQLARKHLADATVDKIVAKIGLDRVSASLKRMTPATNGAAVPTNGHDAALPANDNNGNGGAIIPAQFSL